MASISSERILDTTKSIRARDCFSNSDAKNQPRGLCTLGFMKKSCMFRWEDFFSPSSFPLKHSLVWVYLESLFDHPHGLMFDKPCLIFI